MKVRTGFVSNSSSSSFIINKADLDDMQLYMVRNHVNGAKMFDRCVKWYVNQEWVNPSPLFGWYDEWQMTEDDTTIELSTTMDNFDMESYLQRIGVCLNSMKSWHS